MRAALFHYVTRRLKSQNAHCRETKLLLTNSIQSSTLQVDTGMTTKSFTFNVTFEPEAQQEDIFEHSGIKKLVEMAVNG